MICFICKTNFPLLSTLVVHYKMIHMFKPSSTYECIENHCTQAFPNLDSFKKHVMRKHLKDTSKKLTPVVKNINNTEIPEHINKITNSDSIEPDVF